MIKVDDKVINLTEKIRKALREGQISADSFPMNEVGNLIEYTLGESFWNCIGSKENTGFDSMPEIYKECLAAALERKDMEECGRILQLFECSYQAFYTALNEEEKIFREKPYRQMIIDLGVASAQMQYRQHRERQKELRAEKKDNILGKGRGAVYTCQFGDAELNQPKEVNRQVEYLCFTDKEERWGKKEGVWKYCAIEQSESNLDETILENKYKILSHKYLKEYDYSIWVAPDIIIVGDVLRFCNIYGEGRSFLSFPSAKEDCIYEDISATQMASDDLNIAIRKLMLRYRKEGYPEHNGILDGRVMVRYHGDMELCRLMEKWWEELPSGYTVSENVFNYLAWKHRFPFSVCNLFIYQNPYFQVTGIDLDTREEL